jgi:hypothetical protein
MVLGVTGHQDIPSNALEYVRSALDAEVSKRPKPVGVCSLAAGADQLFAEVIVSRAGKLTVVIPCRDYETTFADHANEERYKRLLSKASDVIELDYPQPSEEAFFAAGQQVVDMADELIAIWDGERAKGHGGTADVVDYAYGKNKPVVVIWPEGVKR